MKIDPLEKAGDEPIKRPVKKENQKEKQGVESRYDLTSCFLYTVE